MPLHILVEALKLARGCIAAITARAEEEADRGHDDERGSSTYYNLF